MRRTGIVRGILVATLAVALSAVATPAMAQMGSMKGKVGRLIVLLVFVGPGLWIAAWAIERAILTNELGVHTRTHDEWKQDPDKIRFTPGSVSITSGVWPDPVTSIEPVYWGVGNDLFAFLVTYHQHGEQKHPTASWVKELIKHPTDVLSFSDPRHWAERTVVMLCSQTTDTSIDLYWHDGLLRSRHTGTAPSVHIPIVEQFVDRMAAKMDGHEGALPFEVINRTASAHFTGGMPIGESIDSGVVDPYLRVFGQPGLHILDGSVMPANTGVNPSLSITALAERAMSLWPNKGDADTRPPLGSGYERIDPVPPHRPAVPAGALGELRLDAKKADVIPEYPY